MEDRNHVKSSTFFFLLDFIGKEADSVSFDPPVIPNKLTNIVTKFLFSLVCYWIWSHLCINPVRLGGSVPIF